MHARDSLVPRPSSRRQAWKHKPAPAEGIFSSMQPLPAVDVGSFSVVLSMLACSECVAANQTGEKGHDNYSCRGPQGHQTPNHDKQCIGVVAKCPAANSQCLICRSEPQVSLSVTEIAYYRTQGQGGRACKVHFAIEPRALFFLNRSYKQVSFKVLLTVKGKSYAQSTHPKFHSWKAYLCFSHQSPTARRLKWLVLLLSTCANIHSYFR